MFDFRYHVVSLTAVFLALVIGILVGVGISGRGLIREGERAVLQDRIDRLESELRIAQIRQQEAVALEAYERETYPLVMDDRLEGRRIAVVFVGSFEGKLAQSVQQAIDDAGATMTLRALKVPITTGDLLRAVANIDNAPRTVEDLGRALGAELAGGDETPLWDAVGPLLVEQREGGGEVDGVVVARTTEPQRGQTARFLAGFYSGLAAASMPVAGVEAADTAIPAVETFHDHGFSTVDNVDTPTGRLALAVVLEGQTGAYGIKDESDAVLPPVDAVSPSGG